MHLGVAAAGHGLFYNYIFEEHHILFGCEDILYIGEIFAAFGLAERVVLAAVFFLAICFSCLRACWAVRRLLPSSVSDFFWASVRLRPVKASQCPGFLPHVAGLQFSAALHCSVGVVQVVVF